MLVLALLLIGPGGLERFGELLLLLVAVRSNWGGEFEVDFGSVAVAVAITGGVGLFAVRGRAAARAAAGFASGTNSDSDTYNTCDAR